MWSQAEVAVSPRYQEIYEALRHQIVDGTYQPGDELPPETVLMDQWQVSRGPIRQALYKLRTEGFIYTTRGRPARVRRPHSPTQTLSSFTPFSQWALTTGREPGNHTISVARTRVTAEIAEALQIGVDDFLIEVVRLRTLDGIPALLERSRFTTDVGASLFDFDPDKGRSPIISWTRECSSLDASRTRRRCRRCHRRRSTPDRFGGTAPARAAHQLRPAGRPFEYSDDRYRPDQVTFSIMNTMTGDERG